ncbi:MAG: transposase, partial [Planctomycetota bacterium]
ASTGVFVPFDFLLPRFLFPTNIESGTEKPGRSAEYFPIQEVVADKAYLSEEILGFVDALGAKSYIPFRKNNLPIHGELWNKQFHFFHFHREKFLKHYHQRSNVESVFSAIKRKFGFKLRSKNECSQINESLIRVITHNLCVLNQAMYELGLDVEFWGGSPTAA